MFIIKSLDRAERFVKQQKSLGNDVFWDNYDIVFHRVDARAISSKNGAFRNGQWGYRNVFSAGRDGWAIDPRNIRRAPRTGN